MNRTVNRYISNGEANQARRMLVQVKEAVRNMPKGYWRSKYWKEINSKFGHLMGKEAGAKLDEMEDNDDVDEI